MSLLKTEEQARLSAAAAAADRSITVAARAATETARDITLLAQAEAESARDEALNYGNARIERSWAALAAVTGMAAGDTAQVVSTDTGTHTDPVVGGTVKNAGVFKYSASPAGWERVADLQGQIAAASAWQAAQSAVYAGGFETPEYASQSEGNAATTAGQIFRVPKGTTPQTFDWYRRLASGSELVSPLSTTQALAAPGSRPLVGDLAIISFPTVAAMLADTSAARGAGTVWRAGMYTYAEAASSASDHDLTTAGGVKLYVVAPLAVPVEALGATAGGNCTSALVAAIAAASRIGHFSVTFGPGAFALDPNVIGLPQNHFSLAGAGKPMNQDQVANVTRIFASSAGGTLFRPASAFSVMSNVQFRDLAIEGASSSDVSTIGIDLSSADALYGVDLDNVAFNNMATGYIPPSGNGVNQGSFQHKFQRISVWNIRNVGVFGATGPSNVWDTCRAGKLTGGTPVAITNITRANPAVVTAAGHGLSNGDLVWIEGVVGMAASDGAVHINDRPFTVANATTNTFQLRGYDTSGLSTAYTSGGTCRKAAVAFWPRGDNDLVIQGDTAAQTSTGGTVQWVVGEDLELGPNAGFRVANIKFETVHFEGCAGHVYFCSGSNPSTASDLHANAWFTPMQWSLRFRYLDSQAIIRSPDFNAQPGASYASHIYVEQVRKGNALLTITPRTVIDTAGTTNVLPIVAGTTGGGPGANRGWVRYDCRTVFEATHNVAQTVDSGIEKQLVNFGNEIVDSHDCHISGVYTAKVPGMYTIGGSIEYPSTVDTSRYEIRYKINGNEVAREGDQASTTGVVALSVGASFEKWLAIGDQVTWHAFYNGGGSVSIAPSIRNRIFVVGPR